MKTKQPRDKMCKCFVKLYIQADAVVLLGCASTVLL